MGQDTTLTSANMYACCERLWNSKPRAPIDLIFDTIDIVCYLKDHVSLDVMSAKLHLQNYSKAKKTAAKHIVVTFWKIWRLGRNVTVVAALTRLQQRFKRARARLMGPYPAQPATNDVDPFSMDAITDMSVSKVFSFRDNGRVYAFDVSNLFASVFTYKKTTNPFTKADIPVEALKRLWKWSNKKELPSNISKAWQTPMLAWTEFCVIIEEKFGLYMQPEWFVHLTAYEVMNVFHDFHQRLDIPSAFMDQCEESRAFAMLNEDESHFALVREAIKLIVANPQVVLQHLHQVCCLCCSIARHCYHVSRALPDWVFDGAEFEV